MSSPQKRRAGARAIDGAQNVERVTVTLETLDREKLRLLGGSPWVRRQIRCAVVEGGKPAPDGGVNL